MPTFDILLSAVLDGASRVTCSPDHLFRVRFDCGRCRTPTSDRPVVFGLADEEPIPGSRGTANVIISCKNCKAVSSVSLVKLSAEPVLAADGPQPVVWGRLECRGVTPTAAELGKDGVTVHGVGEESWPNDDLAGGDFCEYDESAGASVTVTDVVMAVRPTGGK